MLTRTIIEAPQIQSGLRFTSAGKHLKRGTSHLEATHQQKLPEKILCVIVLNVYVCKCGLRQSENGVRIRSFVGFISRFYFLYTAVIDT